MYFLTYLCIVLGFEAHHACYGAVLPFMVVVARVCPVRPRFKLSIVGVPWLREAHGTMACGKNMIWWTWVLYAIKMGAT